MEPTQTQRGNLSADQAVEAALAEAQHLIQDRTAQETVAQLTTYADAFARLASRGLDKPPPDPFVPPDDTMVWLVILKGLFYEPAGPPPLVPTLVVQPLCSEIVVLVNDATGEAITLFFLRADSCS